MRRVAVVVLNWNGWRDTVACVESLRAQTLKPEWIVVVDNASTDDSVQALRAACSDVTLLESGGNFGFAGGNNVGVRWALAQGAEAVWLLNNDAFAEPDALAQLVQTDLARPDAGLIGTRIYEVSRPGVLQCWGGGWINLWAGRAREFDHPVPESAIDYVSGCSLYMTKRGLERSGLLDEGFFMYFEDAELSLRYRADGWALAVADGARVSHRGGASSRPGRKQSEWRTQSLLRVLKLHAPSYRASLVVSTALRGASMMVRREWSQLRALAEDIAHQAPNPDWRNARK